MKPPLAALAQPKRDLIEEMLALFAETPGVQAVVLGGSQARGTARPDSDVDLGLYYAEQAPLRIDDIRAIAARFHLNGVPVVTNFYEWGPWVNGGAWLETRAGRVDFLYRSLEHVERVIAAAQRGEIEWHFAQQPPYGFRSVIYLAETADCVPLHDPTGAVAKLKQSVATYPEPLRAAIVRSSLWSAEFTLFHARKSASQGDVYNTAGCITRVACELVQVLFALNRAYFGGDKGAMESVASFALTPERCVDRLRSILAASGGDADSLSASVEQLAALVNDTIGVAADLYAAKYRLPA